MTVVFGYRHVSWPGFQPCPCNDPGNYVALEVRNGQDYIVCWCGRASEVHFDSAEERSEFIAAHKEAT